MNKVATKIVLVIAIISMLFACKQNEVMDYQLDGKVYFYEYITQASTNKQITEKNFSFALENSSLMVDTFKIQVQLMGNIFDVDRTFTAEVIADSSTAIEGTHYTLLNGVMKANEYLSYLPVVLYRTEDTKEKEVSVLLELTDNGELGPGNPESTTFCITWGDILLRPENWPEYFFGEYSKNKYQFAIDVLGITNWPQTERVTTEQEKGVYTIAEIQHFAKVLNEAYQEYRAESGPIYVDDDAAILEEIYYGSN